MDEVKDIIENNNIYNFDFYFKFLNLQKTLNYFLIGDFDNGDYFISQQIKEELVLKTKYIEKKEGDYWFLTLPSKEINLKLLFTIDPFDESNNIATLNIIEEIEGKEFVTFVADFVANNDESFEKKAFENFNIVKYQEENEIKIQELSLIDKRIFEFKLINNEKRISFLEMNCEICVLRVELRLMQMGEAGKLILEKYQEAIKNQKIDKLTTINFYTKSKAILDEIMFQDKEFFEVVKQDEEIFNIAKTFVSDMIEFEKNASLNLVQKVNKAEKSEKKSEKKPEKKPSSKPNVSAKKSSSSGGKASSPKSPKKVDKKSNEKIIVVPKAVKNQEQQQSQEEIQDDMIDYSFVRENSNEKNFNRDVFIENKERSL